MKIAKKFKMFVLVIFLSLTGACATIPQESVYLSNEVGIGLKQQHQSQIDLINLYFSAKRKNLDEALNGAISQYFKTLTPSGSITLNRPQLGDVASDVMLLNQKNNIAKEELEQARLFLIKSLNDNYLVLNQANSSVTGLLQSAVEVKNANSDVYKKLSDSTNGNIDLEKIFSELDEFVIKGGESSGKGIKLVAKLETLLEKRRTANE
jgi:hypothetical protein